MGDAPVVAVLGPSNIERTARAAGIDPALVAAAAVTAGEVIARRGWGMIVVPDRGVAVSAMDGYLAAGGGRLIGLCPVSGVCEPAATSSIRIQRDRCHEIEADLTWYEQHHRIGVRSHAMITVGLSCGTIAELAWTKWNPAPPPVSLIAGTASALPAELASELSVDLVDLDDIDRWLRGSVTSPLAASIVAEL